MERGQVKSGGEGARKGVAGEPASLRLFFPSSSLSLTHLAALLGSRVIELHPGALGEPGDELDPLSGGVLPGRRQPPLQLGDGEAGDIVAVVVVVLVPAEHAGALLGPGPWGLGLGLDLRLLGR